MQREISRRTFVGSVVAAAGAAALPIRSTAASDAGGAWKDAAIAYLNSLRGADNGYGWGDGERSHLTPTHAVVGAFVALGASPPDKVRLAEFIRTHHPMQLKKLEQEHREFDEQQVQSLGWLGEDASSFRAQVATWTAPAGYLKQYEPHGWPVFHGQVAAFTCRKMLGMPVTDLTPAYVHYVDERRRPNGSFNASPVAADAGSDGHVMNTLWGLRALEAIGRHQEKRDETIAWLQSCQLPGGGFTYQPNAPFAGNDDAAYTWAAVRALVMLGALPTRRDECVNYLWSLRNEDGGFGDRVGWRSNPAATYSALDALAALDALKAGPTAKAHVAEARPPLPDGLKVWTIQIESHGTGSPADAVELARSLRIHLWGAKNAKPAWIVRAQALADAQNVPVRFFVANEEYGTFVRVPGLGTYSHTSDIIAPAGADIGPPVADRGVLTWEQYREQRLAALQKAKGHLIWQFGENEELVRLYLDDSLDRGAYAAISTFHFGNPDFTNSEPFLYRWRGRIPFVALQDAHGTEPWWFADMTEGFRTVFLAKEPTWDAWLDALKNDRVVAIRHDAVSGGQTWTHGGDDRVIEFVKRHEADWRWWDNDAIRRPLASIVATRADEEFEVARPESGVAVRVRCAWNNTTQGLPKTEVAELVKLEVDGVEVRAERVETKAQGARKGPVGLKDVYYRYPMPAGKPGKHVAVATVRAGTRVETKRLEFES